MARAAAFVHPASSVQLLIRASHQRASPTQFGAKRAPKDLENEPTVMTFVDLIKATVVCGVVAFLIYSYPLVGQVVVIAFLSLLWLSYAHQTLAHLRRR